MIDTKTCKACKHRVLLDKMIVCKKRRIINSIISDNGSCQNYEYRLKNKEQKEPKKKKPGGNRTNSKKIVKKPTSKITQK